MRTSFTLAAAAMLALTAGLVTSDVQAKDETVAKVGEKAPDFTLKTLDGKEVSLSKLLAEKKIVVIEWFNPGCPFVVKHHERFPTMANLYKKYCKGDDAKVTWVAINSGAKGKQGHGVELNKKAKAKWKIEYPILLDESGKVGRMYGARTTPHMYVIDAEGKLRYAGAIDDVRNPRKLGEVNYVANALDAVLAGKDVEKTSTKPYGCSVKYAPQN